MNAIEGFTDERNKTWCIHCGKWIAGLEVTRDHVPSRSLLRKPYPPHIPWVAVCQPCNGGFSLDEEYLSAFLGCVLAGSTVPDRQSDSRVSRILSRSERLRAQLEKVKTEYTTCAGETRFLWSPEQARIERVILKNARGHAFFELGEPIMTEPAHIRALPLEYLTNEQRDEFENVDPGDFWPEVGSRMMTRSLKGEDLLDGWVIVQDGVYRYSAVQNGAMLVRSVMAEYLATEVYWSA